MKVRYTRPALADLDAILSYIAEHSPRGAKRVHARIRAVIDLLAIEPRIGTRTDDPTIRRLPILPYPYLVFYEVTTTEVVIHAVRHGAREPSNMPGSS